jgi:DNA-binding MarR family transcriptional regulator
MTERDAARQSAMAITRPGSARATDDTPLDRTLTYRLHLLNKLSDRESQLAYLSESGLPLSESRCLAAIGSFAPLSIKDLAQRANLDKGQASRAAQSLVDQSLVLKDASAVDGRGVVLTLSRKGRSTWQRVMRVIGRRNEQIFGCLDAGQREQLGRLLDRVISNALAKAPTGGIARPPTLPKRT